MLKAKKFSRVKNKELYKFLKNVNIDYNDSTEEKCDSIILYTYYISLYYTDNFCYDFIKHKTFSSDGISFDYTIQKEIYTDTWMLVCDKLLVLYIDDNDIEEFCLSYMFSPMYCFVIYETFFGYIAICISHTTDDVDDVLKFYMMNSSNPKYILMSYFLKNKTQNQEMYSSVELTIYDNDKDNDNDNSTNKNEDDHSFDYYKNIFDISSFIILNQNVRPLLDEEQGCYNKIELYKLYDIIGYGEKNTGLNRFVEFVFNYASVFKNYPVSYLPF